MSCQVIQLRNPLGPWYIFMFTSAPFIYRFDYTSINVYRMSILSVTCDRLVVFPGYSDFLHQ